MKTKSIFAGALVSGLIAGSVALADNTNNTQTTDQGTEQEVTGMKNNCSGKAAKDKNSCSGKKQDKKKKNAKNKCSGKNGCGEKDEGK